MAKQPPQHGVRHGADESHPGLRIQRPHGAHDFQALIPKRARHKQGHPACGLGPHPRPRGVHVVLSRLQRANHQGVFAVGRRGIPGHIE